MVRQPSKVPFGYKPDDESKEPRGTVWVYDSFQDYDQQQLTRLLTFAEHKEVKRLVFYPLHEETLRRMGEQHVEPLYRRVKGLEELLELIDPLVDAIIDRFEAKRKKYTPMDTAFRYLEEKYASPYFVAVSLETANKMAAFDSFEAWIKKVRLWVDMRQHGSSSSGTIHPRLRAFEHRWDAIE